MIGILAWDIRAVGTTLPVTAGTINIDDQNIPAITSSVIVPFDQALFDGLDPRQTEVPRVTLTGTLTQWSSLPLSAVSDFATASGGTIAGMSAAWSGQQLGDMTGRFGSALEPGAPVAEKTMHLDLHVREISASDFDMTISLASDEVLLTDWAPSSGFDLIVYNALNDGLDETTALFWVDPMVRLVCGYGLSRNAYDTTALSVPSLDLLNWVKFSSGYNMIRPILEDTGLKIRPNPGGRGMSLQRPENSIKDVQGWAGPHSHTFTPADVTSVRQVYSRNGDWYDAVMLISFDGHNDHGWPRAETHSRTYLEQLPETAIPSFAMAENITNRVRNRGRFVDIVAPIRLDVFITDQLTYLPEGATPGDEYNWRVKSVSYDLTSATMNIRGERNF